MKKSIICMVACLSIMACNKENLIPANQIEQTSGNVVTITGQISNQTTKVHVDTMAEGIILMTWEESDSVFLSRIDTTNYTIDTTSVFKIVPGSISLMSGSISLAEFQGVLPAGIDKSNNIVFYGYERDTLDFVENDFRPFSWGGYYPEGISFLKFVMWADPVIQLKIKGDRKIGFIRSRAKLTEYKIKETVRDTVVMKFGDSGKQLSLIDTTIVFFPIRMHLKTPNYEVDSLFFDFYDADGNIITSKAMSNANQISIQRVFPLPLVSFEPESSDLSKDGTANCYIVSKAGEYKFKATKGNSADAISSIASVKVLWESDGTSTAPAAESILKSTVSYKNDTISFSTADIFKEGNAVIAAYDGSGGSGNILWSWHIWCTDRPLIHYYPKCISNAALGFMMDRNLGATSSTPGDGNAFGLVYQWGRKDPFMGACDKGDSSKFAVPYPAFPAAESSSQSSDYAVLNPTTFISNDSGIRDWLSTKDNYRWNTQTENKKSINDPCPAGWRVPGETDTPLYSFASSSTSWDNDNKGRVYTPASAWYPAAGKIDGQSEYIIDFGATGVYWCRVTNTEYGRALVFDSGSVYWSNLYRRTALPVRCMRDK